METGCSSEFEGELIFAGYAMDVLEGIYEAILELIPNIELSASGGLVVVEAEIGLSLPLIKSPIGTYHAMQLTS